MTKRSWFERCAVGPLEPTRAYDLATSVFLALMTVVALLTVRDYAISNDEGVQHHYGQLILDYYRSGFALRDVFNFQNLYLYGGLFDIIAVALGNVIAIDAFELRHILCSIIGVAGIAASAATARLIAGARASLIAAVALTVCGAWYGAMFNHTKDIPFAAAIMGATLFLIRIARLFPSPRAIDIAAFGLLAGAGLGMRSLGLLLLVYFVLAIALYMPWFDRGWGRLRFAVICMLRTAPGLVLAYVIMLLAWPWAALSPLNPVRGLFAFSEFHYAIRTMFAGRVYEMANVPRLYVPGYVLARVPLMTLAGVAGATMSFFRHTFVQGSMDRHRDIALLSLTIIVPLASQVAFHGPAFTGMRHFLFLLPPLATLAGIGLNEVLDSLATRDRRVATGGLALLGACFLWEAASLVRLHPYENLSHNALVGGLRGAFRNYDMDYWFDSMPDATRRLEAYLREKAPLDPGKPLKLYSVAVCGERLSFDRTVTLPQLRWDFRAQWSESEFFIAPTHMNCDRDLDGEVVATVERLGVPIAYVKDRRTLVNPPEAVLAARADVAAPTPP
jgi:hypothetical protein